MTRKQSLPAGVYRRMVRGQESFLVSRGRDDSGKQRWKSCRTLAEAKTERLLFENARKQQGESLWLLTAAQRADAVSALDIIKDHPKETLVAAATFYLKQHLSLIRTENLSILVDKYVAEQTADGLRSASKANIRTRLKSFKEQFGNKLVNEVSVDDVRNWDSSMKSTKSPISRRHILNRCCSFYKWAIANKFCYSNPFDPVAFKRPRIQRGGIKFFDVEQCKKILKVFKKHGLGNYAVLGLFCGIRPNEVMRLRGHHFKIDGNRIVITLDSDVTKTVWRRVIELERGTELGDCVWAWLDGNGTLELPDRIVPSYMTFRRKFEGKIQKELGFEWISDGMRHTSATMYYALTRNENATSALLGHTSNEMLRVHYKGLTTESEARKFYALRPK